MLSRNNENLNRLALKIRSPLMFAHVRAAYPGMPVSEQNCHPFMFNNYLWMHNGVIAGFAKVRAPGGGAGSSIPHHVYG